MRPSLSMRNRKSHDRGMALLGILILLAVSVLSFVALQESNEDAGRTAKTKYKQASISLLADRGLQLGAQVVLERADADDLDTILAGGFDPCGVYFDDPSCVDGGDPTSKLQLSVSFEDNNDDPGLPEDQITTASADGAVWVVATAENLQNGEKKTKKLLVDADEGGGATIDDFALLNIFGDMPMGNSFDPYIVVTGEGCEEMEALMIDGVGECLDNAGVGFTPGTYDEWGHYLHQAGADIWARGKIVASGDIHCQGTLTGPSAGTGTTLTYKTGDPGASKPTCKRTGENSGPCVYYNKGGNETVVNMVANILSGGDPNHSEWPESTWSDTDVVENDSSYIPTPPTDFCKLAEYQSRAGVVLKSNGTIEDGEGNDISSTYKRGNGTACNSVLGDKPFVWNSLQQNWQVCSITGTHKTNLDNAIVYSEKTIEIRNNQGSYGNVVDPPSGSDFVKATWVTASGEDIILRGMQEDALSYHSGYSPTDPLYRYQYKAGKASTHTDFIMAASDNDSQLKRLFVSGGDFKGYLQGQSDRSYLQGNICVEGHMWVEGAACPNHFRPYANRGTTAGASVGCAEDTIPNHGSAERWMKGEPGVDTLSTPIIEGRVAVKSDATVSELTENWFQNDIAFVVNCNDYPDFFNGGSTGAARRIPARAYIEE